MVFSSIIFIFYFLPVFLLVYYLAPARFKNAVILAGSIFFYAWGAPKFIFVILGTTAIDFYVVRGMASSGTVSRKRILLLLSLSINLGLLFYFKYSNFFIDNVNYFLSHLGVKEIRWVRLALPIGISFYTFETLTYVVDVYRGIHKPLRNFWDYQLYIILFPKLIAGPIIRYHDFAGQVYDHTRYETVENRLRGFYRFCIGLGKKVLIANEIGKVADFVFNQPTGNLNTTLAWYGAVSYTIQIYFDFSGYSDMAIGLGQMMGFRFPENFNNPYTSLSITDFWRRWHITLGTWMRNYLYIPLGGNRVDSKWRLYFNLWVVFLASGLWHGAAWGFVIWGAYHGLFLVLERSFLGKWLARLGKLSVIYTMFAVVIGWVFFRCEKLTASISFIRVMFSDVQSDTHFYPNEKQVTMYFVAAFFSFFTLSKWGLAIQEKVFYKEYGNRMYLLMMVVSLSLLALSVARITQSTFNPFIYFRF